MLRYLLDTNAVIALMRGEAALLNWLRRHEPAAFAVSSVVLYELIYGAEKSARRKENLARVAALRFEVLAFGVEDARHAGAIRAALERAGTPIGPYDLLIAGQARARGLAVVTRNLAEFERVEGLRVESWGS